MITVRIGNRMQPHVWGNIVLPATATEVEDLLCRIKLGSKLGGQFYPVEDFENQIKIFEVVQYLDCNYSCLINNGVFLQELNYVAAAMKACNDPEIVEEFVGQTNYSAGWDEWCNAFMQEDDLPVYEYDLPDYGAYYAEMSAEEKYGYTCALNNGIYDKLDDCSALDHFDFERYGRYECDYVTLFSFGYSHDTDEFDWYYYDIEEIEDEFDKYKLDFDYDHYLDSEIKEELTNLLVG